MRIKIIKTTVCFYVASPVEPLIRRDNNMILAQLEMKITRNSIFELNFRSQTYEEIRLWIFSDLKYFYFQGYGLDSSP